MYRSAFFNFIAYMICQISKSCNFDMFSDNCDNATLDLFLKLLKVYPIPKLVEIKVIATALYRIQLLHYNYRLIITPGIVVFLQLKELHVCLTFHSS